MSQIISCDQFKYHFIQDHQEDRQDGQDTQTTYDYDRDMKLKLCQEGLTRRERADKWSTKLDVDGAMQLIYECRRQHNVDKAQWLPYRLLFKLMGITAEKALMVIPFLERDHMYDVPEVRKYRFNFCYNGGQNIATGIQQANTEIPLVRSNVVDGIPLTAGCADMVVLNHDTLITDLNTASGLKSRRIRSNYLTDVGRITKAGGVIMAFEYDYPYQALRYENMLITNVAAELGARIIKFNFPKQILQAIAVTMHKPLVNRFEDYFTAPAFAKLFFLRMPNPKPNPIV